MQSQGAAADLQSVERVVFRRLVIFLRGVAVILLPCGHRGLWFLCSGPVVFWPPEQDVGSLIANRCIEASIGGNFAKSSMTLQNCNRRKT